MERLVTNVHELFCQVRSAIIICADCIVTRNKKNFTEVDIPQWICLHILSSTVNNHTNFNVLLDVFLKNEGYV